jgi:hypothetical protein
MLQAFAVKAFVEKAGELIAASASAPRCIQISSSPGPHLFLIDGFQVEDTKKNRNNRRV